MKVCGHFQALLLGPGEASCPNRIVIRNCTEPTDCLVDVETRNFLSLSAVELRFRGHPACCLVTILTELSPLIICYLLLLVLLLLCAISAVKQYLKRNDRLFGQLHLNTCKEIGIKLNNEHWYDHIPKLVEKRREGKVTIL